MGDSRTSSRGISSDASGDTNVSWGPGELRVLVVDDEPDVLLGLKILAESLGADVQGACTGEEALVTARRFRPHVILSDITMPGMSGLDLLAAVKRELEPTSVILITGFGTIELAVTAMQLGAAHFLTKPFDNEDVLDALRRFGKEALATERIRERGSAGGHAATLVARDPRMRSVLELVDRIAPSAASVLVYGESGVGKELIARALHERGQNPDRPFLAVNTAAMPDALIESELFGHKKGAFTGADREREGLFVQAAGGTVFLDEIGLMPLSFQAKLLRVLQERCVVPLGSVESVPVEFRLVAATSSDLKKRMELGEFREDLYYRLQVITVEIPPLRDRPADLEPLVEHFLEKYAESSAGAVPAIRPEAMDDLSAHRWPGNVRELENCIQRALVLSDGGEIGPEHLGLHLDALAHEPTSASDATYEDAKQLVVRRFQRRFVERALSGTHGNVSEAARVCGLTRAALQRIMRSLELDRSRFAAN